LLSACATALLLTGTTASNAEIVFSQPTGLGNFDFNILFQGPNSNGIVTGFGNAPGQPTLINFTSTDALSTSGSGQAAISPAPGGTLNNLSFSAVGTGFSELLLNIRIPTGSDVDAAFNFVDQAGLHFQQTFADLGNGNNFFLATALNGQVITSGSLQTTGPILDVEQVRVDLGGVASAIPETSTWAMILLGFAGVGLLAYRRKSKPAFRWA